MADREEIFRLGHNPSGEANGIGNSDSEIDGREQYGVKI
jgi:hypothetical protein